MYIKVLLSLNELRRKTNRGIEGCQEIPMAQVGLGLQSIMCTLILGLVGGWGRAEDIEEQ